MSFNAAIDVIFLCIINGVFMVMGTFLNSVVIMSLWRSSNLRKKICYFMIFVLSCFDFVVISITHPIIVLLTLSLAFQVYDESLVHVAILIMNMVYGFAMFTLLTLNIERFLSIVYPIFHRTYVTKRRLLYIVAFLQLLTVVLSTFCFQDMLLSGLIVIIVVPLILFSLFFYLNYNIFLVAKQRNTKVGIPEVSTHDQKKKRHMILEFKQAFTCSLAVICYLLCTLPAMVIGVLCFVWDTSLYDENVVHVTLWIPTISSINSTLNCLMLFWKNAVLRHEGMKIIKCFQPKNR
jgi:hypothetical protein